MRRRSATSSSSDRLGQVDHALLDPPAVGDQDQQQPGGGHRHDLHVTYLGARERRVLHDRDLARQLGQQADTAPHHVIEVDGAFEEVSIARRSATDIGLTVDSRSTKSR